MYDRTETFMLKSLSLWTGDGADESVRVAISDTRHLPHHKLLVVVCHKPQLFNCAAPFAFSRVPFQIACPLRFVAVMTCNV